MNRTVTYLAVAGALALVAVVIGLPGPKANAPVPQPQPPPPVVVVQPPQPLPPQPLPSGDGSLRMEARLSHPLIITGRSDLFATVDVTAVAMLDAKRAPVNLALVIDRSGSMNGYKLERAKAAARQLVSELADDDRLSIVHFGSDVRVMPGAYANAENKARMIRYVNNIWDVGGTDIGGGLRAGKVQLAAAMESFKVNRVILLSDGQPTVGITSSRGLTSVAQSIRDAGVSVSAIGVGTDFNEDLMTRIAEVGAGSYGYLKDAGMLATLFSRDLKQASTMVARGVSLTFTLPDGVELGEVLGRTAYPSGRLVQVPLPDFSAAQSEKLVVRLTMNGQTAGSTVNVTDFALTYTDLLKSGPGQAQVHLAALVTGQKDEMLAKRDKSAVVTATRALSAMNFRRAAEAIDRGESKKAKDAIDDNELLFKDAEEVAGAAAVAQDRSENNAVMGAVMAAPAAPREAQLDQVKSLKVRAMKAAGKGASVY
ncbi:MAG: vWA domain-containing protein [Myxococcaceae bacterium]